MSKLNKEQKNYLKTIEVESNRKKIKKAFEKENLRKEFEDSAKFLRKLFKNKINPSPKKKNKKTKTLFSPQIPLLLPKKEHDTNRLNALIEHSSLLKSTNREVPNEWLIEMDNLKKILR